VSTYHDYTMDTWRFAKLRYHGWVNPLTEHLPKLLEDPDIAAAVSAIRNAERAIEARVRELLEDEE
jgi:hypothetical protein